MLQMNIINDTAIIFTSRRSTCCWGPCDENPRQVCCVSCMAERQYNFGSQGANQNGHNNKQNYGGNTKFNYGDQGNNQGGHGNTQNYRKREWMSDTNQLD